MFDFSNYWFNSKFYGDLTQTQTQMAAKMKDVTGGAAFDEFVGLKPKMYSFLLDEK